MTPRPVRPVDDALISVVRSLPIDPASIGRIIRELTAIGSSPWGYRNTGTPEDAAVAELVAAEMRAGGLVEVEVEDVEVDAWRFLGARLRVRFADRELDLEASSFGGMPPTPPGGTSGRLVDVGDPTLDRLDELDLDGALTLVDWRHKTMSPSVFAVELSRRGVAGIIVSCPPGGAWFQADDALGAFESHWQPGWPPAVLIRKEDAASIRTLMRRSQADGTLHLSTTLTPGATGHNVVGYLPGEDGGIERPIVVGAHHDAWFRGGFDNSSGVAALLAIARGLTAAGIRPRHAICFTSRTAEEYGIIHSEHDWCIGAWRQVQDTHPEWQSHSPFHLVLEASGHPQLRTIVEAPTELRRWARAVTRAADAEGWTPTGYRLGPPVSGTEQWPFLVSGVPGVAAYAWDTAFADTAYHTQLDTSETVDPELVARQARLYALLLLSADRDPDATLDHGARARELAKIAAQHHHPALARAAESHRAAQGRAAFTAVGRGLLGIDAHDDPGYPHQQAAHDLRNLDRAIAAHDRGRPRVAARHLAKVGANGLHPYLSHEAFDEHARALAPAADPRTWGSASHLTPTPLLTREIEALGQRTDDPRVRSWVRESLLDARSRSETLLRERLDAMARAIGDVPPPARAD